MARSLVQTEVNGSLANADTLAITIAATGAGNLLVVGTNNDASRTISGVSDGTNAFTQATGAAAVATGTSGACDVWYLLSSTAGKTTITITFNGGAGTYYKCGWVHEVSGMTGGAVFDLAGAASNQTGAGDGTEAGASITTTGVGFIFACGNHGNGIDQNPKSGNEFTSGGDLEPVIANHASCSLIDSTAAAHQPVWLAFNPSEIYCASTAGFKDAGAPAIPELSWLPVSRVQGTPKHKIVASGWAPGTKVG